MTTKLALLALVGGLVLAPTTARAQIYDDDPMPMAPPVRGSYSQYDDTFDWRDVNPGERVEITRASFDQDGYQLVDRRGQIIIVPFENNNLYVMRFGQTSGRTFFVNDGGIPTLYMPANGYLENLAASGARWYPFPQQFSYTRPIYIGVAPSWNDYMVMGWYPGMTYWGGYWDYNPWRVGYRYAPMSSWSIRIGNFSYSRWDDYCGFWRATPARRIVFVDRPSRFSGGYSYNRGRDWNRGDRYSRNEPQKDRLVRPGDNRYNGNGRYDRNDRNDRNDKGRYENNNRTYNSGGSDRFGSSNGSARDRESGRSGYNNNSDSRFSRAGGFDRGSDSRSGSFGSSSGDRFSRPGGFDRSSGGSSSDRRPTGIGQSRPSGGSRAPESRSSGGGRSSGGSSRERESRRQ